MASQIATARRVRAAPVRHRATPILVRAVPDIFGNAQITVQNLKVALIDPERNLIAVRGAIPGPRGSLVVVCEAAKRK